MICPLCGTRKARRGCPAVGQQICAVCCGTKRLVEIRCPSDCTWLASAREHPPAATVRQQQRDVERLLDVARDFGQRQSQILILITTFLAGYQPQELQPLSDEDVANAAEAIASTLETSIRGVIYEHRAASLPAERLAAALKPLLAQAGQGAGTAFDRDAAVVLRRIAETLRAAAGPDANPRAFLELAGRIARTSGSERGEPDAPPRPSLIIP